MECNSQQLMSNTDINSYIIGCLKVIKLFIRAFVSNKFFHDSLIFAINGVNFGGR